LYLNPASVEFAEDLPAAGRSSANSTLAGFRYKGAKKGNRSLIIHRFTGAVIVNIRLAYFPTQSVGTRAKSTFCRKLPYEKLLDCFASLAMTIKSMPRERLQTVTAL
ncbi:MAG: hypothetical protein J7L16_07865, partial [Deltaproteobacteria bacterium]|nr:hypothetical protein [Deltaproteobacteria bacterium]